MALLFDESAIAHAVARRAKEITFLDEWLLDEIQARLAPLKGSFDNTLWEGKQLLTLPLREGRNPISVSGWEQNVKISNPTLDQSLCYFSDPPAREGLAAIPYDLVISYQQLHYANDVPNELLRLGRLLKPDGMFLACFLGGQSLVELRHILAETEIAVRGGVSPRVHPMIDRADAAALMQAAGFALPVVDSETVELHYSNLFALIRDLRLLGLNNMLTARDNRILPRNYWPQAAARYAVEFVNEQGGITVTLEAIFLSGWRPAANQQIPLARGSVPLGFNSAS